jgi:hypothetical protein
MDIIHQVVISDTPSFKSNSLFVDIIKPLDAKKCFLSVEKFNANYAISPVAVLNTFPPTEEFELHCDSVQNSYRYNTAAKMVVRSTLVDTYLTRDIVDYNQQKIASFNVINGKDTWLQIDINKLPCLTFSFVNNLLPGENGFFNLHLKFKFE